MAANVTVPKSTSTLHSARLNGLMVVFLWAVALIALAAACSQPTADQDVRAASDDLDGTADPAGELESTPDDTAAVESDTATADGDVLADPIVLPVGINPTRIEIPAIDVDAAVVTLDLRGAEPEVPSNFADTGWYQQTRRPGEIGPAVVAGHIDSKNGPAVFARLDQLGPGDRITIHDATGGHRTFTVTAEGQYGKDDLPPEVFNFDKPTPELRLITCGGVFDRSTGHYQDNFVIYAELDV